MLMGWTQAQVSRTGGAIALSSPSVREKGIRESGRGDFNGTVPKATCVFPENQAEVEKKTGEKKNSCSHMWLEGVGEEIA